MSQLNNQQHAVLVIAEDPSVYHLLEEILANEFCVKLCEPGNNCIQALHNEKPDLILLAINLQDKNNLEIAKRIKHEPDCKDIPIIFVSDTEDEEVAEEIKASDFICKPFNSDEILHKIRLTIEFNLKILEQNKIIDETRQMAFTAMSQSGEIGQILHFMRDSFECDTYEKLGNRLLEAMEAQQLNTVIRFHTNPPVYFSHEGEIARLDQEILDRLFMLERIVDFGIRSLYNFDKVSLLVKNMPVHDEGLYGRVKDNVCLFLEAVDARINGIGNEIALHQRDQSLSQIIDSSKRTLKEIEAAFLKNAQENEKIMLDLKEKIEWSYLQLGLSEDQEQEISGIVQDAENKSTALYDTGLKIEERLTTLTEELNRITNS